jgi:hypothetical protein
MSDIGQCQLNPIHFFTNYPYRLMIARMRQRFDRFCRVTNLIAAISDEVDSRGGLHSIQINPSGQLCSHPGERQPEQHLEGKTISCSVKIAERESVHGFTQTDGCENYSYPNQCKGQAIVESKFRSRLRCDEVLRKCHGPPLRYEIGRSNALRNNTCCYQAISLIDPATISQLLRGFDLRNLVDTLRVSSIGNALEALRTAIHTSPMGLDVQFALADR